MQPVIVRGGGGGKGVICHGQGTSILSRGGGISINNSNNVYSSCLQEFFIRLL